MLSVFGAVHGQDNAAAETNGVDAEGRTTVSGDEESWQYVEFLKANVK